MPEFKIISDPTDDKTQMIVCTAKQLAIRINKHQEAYSPDALIIYVEMFSPHLKMYGLYFDILHPENDPQFNKWSMSLFLDAITFYYLKEYNCEPTGIQLINQQNFYPYQKGEVIY